MAGTPAPIPVTLGGKERYLKYELASFVAAQTRYRVRLTLSMLQDPSVADIVILFWIGLLPDQPTLPLRTAARWVDEAGLDYDFFAEQVLPAAMDALGMTEAEEEGEAEGEGAGSVEDLLDPLA